MDRTERFYKIHRLLKQRRVVSRRAFETELEVSRATFKRDLEYLRDRMNMPIIWDREHGGYRLDETADNAHLFQLPGLWFSAEEVRALLTMEQLLQGLQPGLLENHVRPLRERIRRILGSGDFDADELTRRIRILQMGVRPIPPEGFQAMSSALLSRRRLRIDHYRRSTDETTAREVSPQRLVFYRDNWYLDAWCHLRKALRTFAADAITDVEVLSKRAREISDTTLDDHFGAGFGIFSGQARHTAVLRFSAVRARWVSREIWHPDQDGQFELDGAYVLKVPYANASELVMDILKYGADVEVLAPAALREQVKDGLEGAAALYRGES